jgi:hypothetical protein
VARFTVEDCGHLRRRLGGELARVARTSDLSWPLPPGRMSPCLHHTPGVLAARDRTGPSGRQNGSPDCHRSRHQRIMPAELDGSGQRRRKRRHAEADQRGEKWNWLSCAAGADSWSWKTTFLSARQRISRGRTSSQSNVPAGPRAHRRRYSRRGGLPGTQGIEVRLLQMARPSGVTARNTQPGADETDQPDPRGIPRHLRVAAGARQAGAGRSGQPQARRPADAAGRAAGHLPAQRPEEHLVNAATEEDRGHRQFHADALRRLWVTGTTDRPTAEGKLHCAAVMDACSRRIIGWSIDNGQKMELAIDALGMAILRRHPAAKKPSCIPITTGNSLLGHSARDCVKPGCSAPRAGDV